MKPVKTVLVVALIAMAVLGLSLPASAHVTFFSWELVRIECIDPSCDTFTAQSVIGEIRCSAGENYVVTGRVLQKEDGSPGYRANFRAKGTCRGPMQDWGAPIHNESGYMVCDKPFGVFLQARTFVGTTWDGGMASASGTIVVPCE